MSLIEVDAVDDSLDGLIERRVFEDDVRRLAAQLERQLLLRAGRRSLNALAHFGRAGEGDLVDVRMGDKRCTRTTRPGDDVHHARWQFRFLNDLREQQRSQRRRFRRFENDGVAGGKRRRDLPRRHQQRKVPRNDLAGHAKRRHVAIGKCVFQLVRPPGVVKEVRGGERNVDVARLLDRLPAVHRLHDGECTRLFLNQPGDAEDVLGALARCDLAPHFVVRTSRFFDRAVDILRIRLRHLRQRLLGRRIDRLEPPLRMRRNELTTDEKVVALGKLDVIGGLEGRRIMPFHQGAAGGSGGEAIAGFESSRHKRFEVRSSR